MSPDTPAGVSTVLKVTVRATVSNTMIGAADRQTSPMNIQSRVDMIALLSFFSAGAMASCPPAPRLHESSMASGQKVRPAFRLLVEQPDLLG